MDGSSIGGMVTFGPCEGGGACVEVAKAEIMLVRDSKNPDGPVLIYFMTEWQEFVRRVKAGEFD